MIMVDDQSENIYIQIINNNKIMLINILVTLYFKVQFLLLTNH